MVEDNYKNRVSIFNSFSKQTVLLVDIKKQELKLKSRIEKRLNKVVTSTNLNIIEIYIINMSRKKYYKLLKEKKEGIKVKK